MWDAWQNIENTLLEEETGPWGAGVILKKSPRDARHFEIIRRETLDTIIEEAYCEVSDKMSR